MTDNNHPITPPPELVQEWIAEWSLGDSWAQVCQNVALVAACWGADQELKACCEWLSVPCPSYGRELRNARRPKPPSLKERALKILEEEPEADDMKELIVFDTAQVEIIRRALEMLPNE